MNPTEHVAQTDTIHIATLTQNGAEIVTPVWGVVCDGAIYIRNGYGEKSNWYRRARPAGSITLVDGPRRQLATIERVVDEHVIHQVDHAYRAKYQGQGVALGQALSRPVRRYTLLVSPQAV